MSVIPIDKHDRDAMLNTLEDLKFKIKEGETIGYVIITLNKDGSNAHAHNAEVDEFLTLIGLLELKKRDLLDRYESYLWLK